MSFSQGQTVSHYRLQEKIGEGGMGQVFRATDTRLGRDVAIKTLPEDLAADADRLARFQREAQVLASLNHPNIAAIHGLEESGGHPFLVLELVAGEDLSARLRRGPLAVEECVQVGLQIAAALEEAHERGIVHRDLKPANIKVTPEGRIKVLDFGLAKAIDPAPTGGPSSNISLSPTMTAAATRAGIILGTAAYMSLEQARGDVVDRRADIWAFGVVLLEMLTGRSAFTEPTVSDTLASVLKSEPAWDAVPADTPPSLQRLLRRCLTKNAKRRLRDIGEARIVLEALASGEPDPDAAGFAAPVAGDGPVPARRWGLIVAGAVVATAILTATVAGLLRAPGPVPEPERFQIAGGEILSDQKDAPAISPDGRMIAFLRQDGIRIREMSRIEERPLEGTAGAEFPFWSPASDQIGFVRAGSIWAVPATGGEPRPIALSVGIFTAGAGLCWGTDGRIVYSRGSTGLMEISSRGGEPRALLDPVEMEEGDLHEPSLLPDGRSVIYVSHRLATAPDTIRILDEDGPRDVLQIPNERLGHPVYSATGHILYRRTGTRNGLWAVPFSLAALRTTGDPFLLTSDGSYPSVAADGSLLYIRGAETGQHQLVWLDRAGNITESIGQPQTRIASPVISPDGGRIAVMAQEQENWDIWIHDLARSTRTRLTFTPGMDWDPSWMPDGSGVVYWDGQSRAISMKPADGAGEAVRLVTEDLPDSGDQSIAPDGLSMAFWARGGSFEDIWVMPLEGERTPRPLIATPAKEESPRISPDGDLLAYVSDESGRDEIFLTRFPTAEGKWQVSSSGGIVPRWGPQGDRIFYLEGTRMMEVEVVTRPSVRLGTPRVLFDTSGKEIEISHPARFGVSPDGDRFVMVQRLRDQQERASLVLVRHWPREFEDRP